jgi:hypothetical protein
MFQSPKITNVTFSTFRIIFKIQWNTMKKLISLFLLVTAVYSCGQDKSEVSSAVPVISKNISDTVVIKTPKSLVDEFFEISRNFRFAAQNLKFRG